MVGCFVCVAVCSGAHSPHSWHRYRRELAGCHTSDEPKAIPLSQVYAIMSRVLWAAIHGIQNKETDIISVVYSGDTDTTKEKIIQKVKVRCL